MKIRDYEFHIDMTPETHHFVDYSDGNLSVYTRDVYTDRQKIEFDRRMCFLQAELYRFVNEMRDRTDFYIWTEEGKKPSDYELFELTMLNIRDSELPQLVGLDTVKGSVGIDSSYSIYWG